MSRNQMDADSNFRHHAGDVSMIPPGPYCYNIAEIGDGRDIPAKVRIRTCPYWGGREFEGSVMGYCAKLRKGDWDRDGPSLLHDMVKECGVNDPEEAYG